MRRRCQPVPTDMAAHPNPRWTEEGAAGNGDGDGAGEGGVLGQRCRGPGRVPASEVPAPTAGVAAAPSALPHTLSARPEAKARPPSRSRRDPRPEPSLRTGGEIWEGQGGSRDPRRHNPGVGTGLFSDGSRLQDSAPLKDSSTPRPPPSPPASRGTACHIIHFGVCPHTSSPPVKLRGIREQRLRLTPLGINTELLAPSTHRKTKEEKGEESNQWEEKEKEEAAKGERQISWSPGPRGLGWGPPLPLAPAHTAGAGCPLVPAAEAVAGELDVLVPEPDRLARDPPCDLGHVSKPRLSAPASFGYWGD